MAKHTDFSIGIISDEVDWQLMTAIEWAIANEVNQFEIRTVDGKYVHLLTEAEAKAAAQTLSDAGITVSCLASGFGKCNLHSSQETEAHLENLKRLVEYAGIFGTTRIRAFGGWRDHDVPSVAELMLKMVSRALEIIPQNIVLAFENEPATNLSSIHDVALLRREHKDKRIMALYDPGNNGYDISRVTSYVAESWSMMEAITEGELAESIDLVAIMHCKNTCTQGFRTDTVPLDDPDGIVDFEDIIAILEAEKKFIPLDLEPHRLGAGEQLSEETRAVPGGQGYGNPDNALADLQALRGILQTKK